MQSSPEQRLAPADPLVGPLPEGTLEGQGKPPRHGLAHGPDVEQRCGLFMSEQAGLYRKAGFITISPDVVYDAMGPASWTDDHEH